MSKNNNANWNHYKTAGRERQSEQDLHQTDLRVPQEKRRRNASDNFIPGAAPVGESGKKEGDR
jgi:hypothetical protein